MKRSVPSAIVHIVLDYPPRQRSGVGVSVGLLAGAQARSGDHVTIIAADLDAMHSCTEVREAVRVVRIGRLGSMNQAGQLDFARLRRSVADVFRALDAPAVLHTHHWIGAEAASHAKGRGVVHVVTDHGHAGLASAANAHPSAHEAFVRESERACLDAADGIAFVSVATMHEAVALGLVGGRTRSLAVTRNPIAQHFFVGRRPRESSTDLCFVGRAEREKGFHTFCETVACNRRVRPADRARAIIPYGVLDVKAKRLDSWGQGWDLAPLGKVLSLDVGISHRCVARRLRSCRVVVLPTQYESCGLAILEALAAGTRVVATDLPALREALAVLPRAPLRLVDRSASPGEWQSAYLEARDADLCRRDVRESLKRHFGEQVVLGSTKALYVAAGSQSGRSRVAASRRSRRGRGILLITPEAPEQIWGGIGTWVRHMIKGWGRSARAPLTVLVLHAQHRGRLGTIATMHGVRVFQARPETKTVGSVVRALASAGVKPRTVHASIHDHLGVGKLIASAFGASLVYTAHSNQEEELLHGSAIRSPAAQIASMMGVDAVVAVSPNEAQRYRRATHLRMGRNLFCIANACEAETVPAPSGKPICEDLNVLFAGRWVPHKRVLELVRSMQVAVRTDPHLRLTLIGRGHGERGYENAISDVIQRDPLLRSRTSIQGWLDRTQLQRQVVGAHLVASFAAYEPFGYAYLDALLNGVPLLVTRTAGSEWLLGRHYPYVTPPSYLAPLLTARHRMSALRALCLQRAALARRRCAPERMVGAYRKVYSSVAR